MQYKLEKEKRFGRSLVIYRRSMKKLSERRLRMVYDKKVVSRTTRQKIIIIFDTFDKICAGIDVFGLYVKKIGVIKLFPLRYL